MPSNKSKNRKDVLRKQAVTMAESRAKRSNKEQLAQLDARLGKGVGATKERARLAQ